MAPTGTMFLKYENREFQEDSIMITDSTIFKVFTHPFIAGDPEKALNRPYTMVMTESLARKYFGEENPIGKTLTTLEGELFEITGVIKDLPGNVHMKFDGLISAATFIEQIGVDRFNDRYPFQYSFLDENMADYYRSEERIGQLARSFTILTIIIAALGLLGLSSFLTQARTREVGIRKVLGATAENIMVMFAREFSIWVIAANVIAAPLAYFFVNKWLQSFPYKTNIHLWIFLLALMLSLIIALLTVSLRVFQSASTNPAEAIRYT